MPLLGEAVAAYKVIDKDLNLKNVNEQLFVYPLMLKMVNNNLVALVHDSIQNIITPTMAITKDWGDLPKTAVGLQIKKDFLGDFDCFVQFLESTTNAYVAFS